MSQRLYDEHAFEDAIEAHLLGHGGYQELNRAGFDPELGFFTDEVIGFIQETQPDAWEAFETSYGSRARKELLRQLKQALERNGTLHVLRHGLRAVGTTVRLAFFKPVTGLNPETQRRYEQNRITITRQLPYARQGNQTLDMALIVNGLPVATVELKNEMTSQGIEHAKTQYRQDRDPAEPVLRFKRGALVHFAVTPHEVAYTTKLAGKKTHFLPFNKGRPLGTSAHDERAAGNPEHPSGYRAAYIWEDVWAKDSLLELIQRFLHIDTEETPAGQPDKEILIFPRYHQLECVRNLVHTAQQEGAGHNYLVQHSTGSGKSKSIAWLAHRLFSLHTQNDERVFDSVVVVTDRRVLDSQIQDAIYEIEQKSGIVHGITRDGGAKSTELAEKLEQGKPIIVTTLQTFPYVIEHIGQLPDRDYAVIVDEAHSSQTGEMAKSMKQILAGIDVDEDDDWQDLLAKSAQARGQQDNLSFFAFTATPKGKTLEVFGRTPENAETPLPFHVYSMRQAIEERFILDVLQHYTTYKTYYKLNKKADEDPKVPKKAASKEIRRYLELHPYNISQKVHIIIEHFREHTMKKIGGRAKAMIVTRSRKHAVRYKLAIDAYLMEEGYGDIKALVAFSGKVEDEGVEYTEPGMNDGISETELPQRFATDEYQVLIVAEKYQTGFDQPLLHTMYVDRSLTGIQAVQTLSRLNRTHPGKDDTFILDFQNDAKDILKAFQQFYEYTTTEGRSDPQHLYQLEQELGAYQLYTQAEIDNFCQAFFDPNIPTAKEIHPQLYRWTKPALDRFQQADQETQEEFRSKLRAYLNLYKFQTQVVTYTDEDLEALYTYGRLLYPQLPRPQREPHVELGDDLALEYYRLEKVQEKELELVEDQEGQTPLPQATGSGTAEDEEEELSAIIQRINEALGAREWKPADRLFLEQAHAEALERDDLVQAAKANDEETLAYIFDRQLESIFIDLMENNQEIVKILLNNPEVKQMVTDQQRKKFYNAVNEE